MFYYKSISRKNYNQLISINSIEHKIILCILFLMFLIISNIILMQLTLEKYTAGQLG